MKTISRKISLALNSVLATSISATCLTPLTSCGASSAIQLANFESYMSDDLIEDLQSKYSIQFPYFTVTEMIETKFEKYYDIAVPSVYEVMSLLRRGWLEKIDWTKFQVKNTEGQDITNAESAKSLFKSDSLDAINKQFAEYITVCYVEQELTGKVDNLIKTVESDGTWSHEHPEEFNALNYGVPYFTQTFTFCYKGDKIKFYKATNDHTEIPENENPTWADVFYTISPANPKLDPRFDPNNGNRLGLVDDAKTIYDIARIIETTLDPSSSVYGDVTNEIPEDESIPRMVQTFSKLTGNFANKDTSWFVANSDSGIISKLLADPKGSSGAFSWSGDAIYGARGAEEYPAYNSKNFHFQKIAGGNLDETEFLVMNKKNLNNTTRRNQIYDIVKQICLDGCDVKDIDELCSKVNDKYKYWTITNFDSVCYTPMLKNVYEAMSMDKKSEGKTGKDRFAKYWQGVMDDEKFSEDTIELFIDILTLNLNDPTQNHLLGRTLTPLQNSNNHWAWLESRAKL